MVRHHTLAALVCISLLHFANAARSQGHHHPPENQGQDLILELDNEFIHKYANRATISSEFTITGISAPHAIDSDGKDGEVHIGGWCHEAGLAGVSEIMNVANEGKGPRKEVLQAFNGGQTKLTFTGAWRLWGEHGGATPQLQARGTEPSLPLPGEFPSNPDHIFEIHPVATIQIGNNLVDATLAVGDIPGFQAYDAQMAFLQGYETLGCTIIPKGNRTRLLFPPFGFNFTEFIIRLGEDPVALDDGHGVICSVFDTEGELVLRSRRMVFVKGTLADEHLHGLKKGDRMRVLGIPRISLKLVQWRLDHQNDKDDAGQPKWDVSPLRWRLPYEMIVVAAERLGADE